MSFWDSVKKFAQPYADEEYDEYDEEMDEMEEEEEAAPRAPRRAPAFGGAAPAAPAPNFNMPPQQQPAPQGFTPPAAVNRAGAFNTAAPAAPAPEAVPVMAVPYTLSPVSFLAEGAQWEGTLRSEGDVEVSCPFHGELYAKGAVTLHSAMEGNVTAGSLTLAGCTLTGDVVCEGLLVISRDSRICGNITTRELRCAGTVTGDITATDTVVLESTARINGGIATATLAVDKGAVICGGLTIKE